MYIYACIHTYLHTCIHTYIHTCSCWLEVSWFFWLCLYGWCVSAGFCCTCVEMCVRVSVCMCACVSAFLPGSYVMNVVLHKFGYGWNEFAWHWCPTCFQARSLCLRPSLPLSLPASPFLPRLSLALSLSLSLSVYAKIMSCTADFFQQRLSCGSFTDGWGERLRSRNKWINGWCLFVHIYAYVDRGIRICV